MTELIVVRHGEAHCNVEGTAGGPAGCTGLTDRGRSQVQLLGERLRSESVDVAYCGTRLRVSQTARIITRVAGLPMAVEPELEGLRHGAADGRKWQQIENEFGGPPMAFPDRPYAQDSETWNGFVARTAAVTRMLLDRHDGQRILIVAHGETVAAVHTALLDLPAGARVDFPVANASVSRWALLHSRFGTRVRQLLSHNDTAHLTAGAP